MKRVSLSPLGLVAILALLPWAGPRMSAQARPTASGPGSYVSVGGEGTLFQADYGKRYLGGIAAYADVHPHWRYGGEVEARFLRFNTDESVTETTYLAGAHINVLPGRLRPYGKFLIGVGKINFPFNYATGSYLVYAPGGGVDYVLNERWTVRFVDAEYQIWPQFSFGALHPYGVSAGIAFRLNPEYTIPKHARGRN
jgi:hypothetical protein